MKFIFYIFSFSIISLGAHAHTYTGMIGFYDGLSHPVLGLDHFLAMVSVGIISAQIGGRAIWTIPFTFVLIMIVGGLIGIYAEMNQLLKPAALNEIGKTFILADFLYLLIEIGILLSVIALGLAIAIEKKLPVGITMIFIGIFGFFHGSAHGLEMPWAANPFLFALGFATGTTTLHIFGVIIGYFSIKTKSSIAILRIAGICFAAIGFYSLITL